MERYYLFKLPNISGTRRNYGSSLHRKTSFVEISGSGVAYPTFGVVYFGHGLEDATKSIHQVTDKDLGLYLTFIDLSSDANEFPWKDASRVRISRQTGMKESFNWVDFSIKSSIVLKDHTSDDIDCILLDSVGHLYGLNLTLIDRDQDLNSKKLTSGDETHLRLHHGCCFIKCQIQNWIDKNVPKSQIVHILADKGYFSYYLDMTNAESKILRPRYEYLPGQAGENFVNFCVVQTNSEITIIEDSHNHLRIIKGSLCLFTIELKNSSSPKSATIFGESLSLLKTVSRKSRTEEEIVVLTMVGSCISAYGIRINSAGSGGETNDPDDLLIKSPSFEVEDCWSIDLTDLLIGIPYQRSSTPTGASEVRPREEDGHGTDMLNNGCIKFLLETDNEWPRMMSVAYGHNLFFYSFVQQQSSFSSSISDDFLFARPSNGKIAASTSEHAINYPLELIEMITHPRLLSHYRLIGTNSGDTLFNRILLADGSSQRLNYLSDLEYMSNFDLLLSITEDGHLICFKLTDTKAHLKQQLTKGNDSSEKRVIEVISGSSLLKQQIIALEHLNTSLKKDYQNLLKRGAEGLNEPTGSYGSHDKDTPANIGLDDLLQVELRKSDQDGSYPYDLKISTSSTIRIIRIMVVSTVASYFLKPSYSSLSGRSLDYFIENDGLASLSSHGEPRILLISNVGQSMLNDRSSNVKRLPQELQKPIQTWAVLNIENGPQEFIGRQGNHISIPVFITDGQTGQLVVTFFYTYNSHVSDSIGSNPPNIECDDLKFHSKTIEVKPLISFKILREFDVRSEPMHEASDIWCNMCVRAIPTNDRMLSWIPLCLDKFRAPKQGTCIEYRSSLTGCKLRIRWSTDDKEALFISCDDFMSLELLKKYLLTSATDESIKLGIVSQSKVLGGHLSRLIGLRMQNFSSLIKITHPRASKKELTGGDETLRQLRELLVNEIMDSTDLLAEYTPADSIVNDIMKDVEELLIRSGTYRSAHQAESDKGSIFEVARLIEESTMDFVIDALVDFDRIHGKSCSGSTMHKMRSKLAQLVDTADEDVSPKNLISEILSIWRELSGSK